MDRALEDASIGSRKPKVGRKVEAMVGRKVEAMVGRLFDVEGRKAVVYRLESRFEVGGRFDR